MPGPHVHLRLTARWAEEAGLEVADALAVGFADLETDALWPGRTHWGRHFNPTAALLFHPMYLARAIRLKRSGAPEDAELSLRLLGRSLHSRQDSIGHGIFGLAHLRNMAGLLARNPDDWEAMPPDRRRRIERASRDILARYVAAPGPASAAQDAETAEAPARLSHGPETAQSPRSSTPEAS